MAPELHYYYELIRLPIIHCIRCGFLLPTKPRCRSSSGSSTFLYGHLLLLKKFAGAVDSNYMVISPYKKGYQFL